MNESAVRIPLDDESLVAQATDEFMEALRQGQHPDVEAFADRYPEIGPVLRQVLGALVLLRSDGLAAADGSQAAECAAATSSAALGDYLILREIGRGGMGVVYEAEQLSLGRRVALKVLPFAAAMDARHLQRFKTEAQAAAQLQHQNIVPVYAVGCDRGVHYYAMQFIDGHPLSAVIADLRSQMEYPAAPGEMPMTAPSLLGSAVEGAEFKGAAADTVGTQRPDTSVATDASIRSREYFRSVAKLGIQAAEGLEHAHGLGIVHRDIKPANLLLDAHGNLWITDFGLAQVQSDGRLTMSGDILGTLRYMSPEQALRQPSGVDHRTDIYSLAVTLYELLTLEPVFGGDDRRQLLQQIIHAEPLAPRRRNGAIPVDLETIVLKAMAKAPGERYATAQELADDLRRFMDDHPIQARRPTLPQRVRKWSRRHRSLVWTALASLIVILAASATVLAVSNARINAALGDRTAALGARTRALGERTKALQRATEATTALQGAMTELQAEQRRTRLALSYHTISLADREWDLNHIRQAEDLLDSIPEEFRHWEWNYLKQRCHRERLTLSGHNGPVDFVRFSDDGSRIFTAGRDSTVRIWDARTGNELHRFERPGFRWIVLTGGAEPLVTGVRRNADSLRDYDVQTWNVISGAMPFGQWTAQHNSPAVAISRDGLRQLYSPKDDVIRLLDASGQGDSAPRDYVVPAAVAARRAGAVNSSPTPAAAIAFSPDDKLAAACFDDLGVIIWELASGRVEKLVFGTSRTCSGLSFSPDGERLIVATPNRLLVVWLNKGAMPVQIHAGNNEALPANSNLRTAQGGAVFSTDGKFIATGGEDGAARVWLSYSGLLQAVIRAHDAGVRDVAFSPNNEEVASASADGTVKLWGIGISRGISQQDCEFIPTPKLSPDPRVARLSAAVWSSDARWYAGLVGSTISSRVHLGFGSVTGEPRHEIPDNGESPSFPIIVPGTNLVVVAQNQRGSSRVVAWDAASGTLSYEQPWEPGPSRRLALSPDGRHFAAIRAFTANPSRVIQSRLSLHESSTGAKVAELQLTGRHALAAAVAPGGDRVACLCSGGDQHELVVVDANSGSILAAVPSDVPFTDAVFDADGRQLAAADGNGDVAFLEPRTGRIIRSLGEGSGHRMAFNPDGSRLATVTDGGDVNLWESATGRKVLALEAHVYVPNVAGMSLRFSPDGHLLLLSQIGGCMIWDATPFAPAARP